MFEGLVWAVMAVIGIAAITICLRWYSKEERHLKDYWEKVEKAKQEAMEGAKRK